MPKEAFENYYKKLLGEKEFEQFWISQNKFYPKAFRVNTLKQSISEFKKNAKKEKWKLEKIPFCKEGFFVDLPSNIKSLGSTIVHNSGYGYVQGATSMYPVELLDVKKGDVVLDLCASPGGKSTHIAQKLNGDGLIVANEISRNRLAQLRENIERLGIWNAVMTNLSPDYFAKYFPKSFDKILVDAPCSGEGMINKSSEVLKKWSIKYVEGFARMQMKILKNAFEALKEGGTIVYSTCTLNEIENEGVLKNMKEIYGDAFEVVSMKKFWPHIDLVEGFFSAKILKQGFEKQGLAVSIKYKGNREVSEAKNKWKILPKHKRDKILKDFMQYFGFEVRHKILLVQYEETIWMQPALFWEKFKYMSVKYVGMPFAKINRKGEIEYMKYVVNVFGHLFQKHLIELDDKEVEQFFCSHEFPYLYDKEGIFALTKKPYLLGLCKLSNGKIKKL